MSRCRNRFSTSSPCSSPTAAPGRRRSAVPGPLLVRGKVFRRGWLDAAAIHIGEPGLTPHELRHTSASITVNLGANVKAVQRMLGHASAAVTLDVYGDLFDADTDALGAALDLVASRPVASIPRPEPA